MCHVSYNLHWLLACAAVVIAASSGQRDRKAPQNRAILVQQATKAAVGEASVQLLSSTKTQGAAGSLAGHSSNAEVTSPAW